MKYYLGIDNGGTVIKSALYDEVGNQIAVASEKVELICEKAGYTERNLNDVWMANVKAIRRCIENSKVNPDDIRCVGLSGHGKGLYIIDKQGNPVYNGIVSTDSRAYDIEREFYKTGVAEKAKEKTYQKVLACQPVCLLKWFKENKRDVYDKIGYVLSVKDYLRYCLTGEIKAELTDISGTNLINLKTLNYDEELLKLFGIDEIKDKLAPICKAMDVCGYITKEVTALTGLKEGTAVSGGMFDIDACAVGVGLTDEKDICVIGGTWSINEYISKEPVLDGSISMNSAFMNGKHYLIEECSPTSCGNLEWIIDNFFGKDKADAGSSEKFYEVLNNGVDSINPEDSNVIFLPFLFDCNENAKLGAGIFNMNIATSKMEIARAVYEGVAFSHKTHVDRLLKSRTMPDKIRLAGGVTKSKVWSQMFSDVLGIKVEAVADKELGCFGAAIASAVAVGDFKDIDTASQCCVGKGTMYYPDSERHKVYVEKYNAYKNLIGKLKEC